MHLYFKKINKYIKIINQILLNLPFKKNVKVKVKGKENENLILNILYIFYKRELLW